MIVTCERCKTQFQLDAARVSEPGVLVRCSRCKHAFVVKPPEPAPERDGFDSMDDDDATFDWQFDNDDLTPTQAQAAQARDERTRAATALEDDTTDSLLDLDHVDHDAPEPEPAASAAPEPEPTFETTPEPEPDPEPPAFEARGSLELDAAPDEPDLELDTASPAFADALDAEAVADAPSVATAEDDPLRADPDADDAPTTAVAAGRDARREELADEVGDELGSPGDWDIFDVPASAPARAPLAAAAPRRTDASPRRRRDDATRRWPTAAWMRHAGSAAGWLASAGLCVIGLAHGLLPAAPAAGVLAPPAPGLAFEDVRGRFVENTALGDVYVVSGALRNEGASPVAMPELELVLRDAARQPVGDPLQVGGPKTTVQLREASGAELTRAIPMLLGVEPGALRRFEAVAWPLPRTAERFEIRARR